MTKQCWNGPQCKFFAQGTCFYYHPPHHITNLCQNSSNNVNYPYFRNIYNSSSFYNAQYQSYNMQISNQQSYQPNFQMRCPISQIQHRNVFINQNASGRYNQLCNIFLETNVFSQSLVLPQQQFNSSIQVQNQNQQQSEDLSYVNSDSYDLDQQQSQNDSEQWGSQNFVDSLNAKFLNKNWFFQKNKHLKEINLTSQFLERCSECAICYDSFKKQLSLQQKDVSYKDKQFINPNETCEQQNLITELFCKHSYHKNCIKKWLKQNNLCPLCKQDFRMHDQYKQWDQNYIQKIKKYEDLDDSGIWAQDDNISLGSQFYVEPQLSDEGDYMDVEFYFD